MLKSKKIWREKGNKKIKKLKKEKSKKPKIKRSY